MEKGKRLIEEDADQYESKLFSKNLKNCVNRLNDFIKKLEQTNERLSVVIEEQEGTQEVEQLINDDWSYIASVIKCRVELMDIQESLQDQNLRSKYWSSITVTEARFNEMIQMTAHLQQVLIGQQQIQQQPQFNMNQPSRRQTSAGDSVRLPKLEIPSVNGENLKWTEFWDSFEASIHE